MKPNSGARSKHPFVYRATTLQIAGIAALFGVTIWVFIAGLDLLASFYSEYATVPMATLDSAVGLACGVLLFKLMMSERARHQQMIARLRMIAEMNHHVRNALDRIELRAHITHDQQLIADIEGGVERIQWALKELLPEKAE